MVPNKDARIEEIERQMSDYIDRLNECGSSGGFQHSVACGVRALAQTNIEDVDGLVRFMAGESVLRVGRENISYDSSSNQFVRGKSDNRPLFKPEYPIVNSATLAQARLEKTLAGLSRGTYKRSHQRESYSR